LIFAHNYSILKLFEEFSFQHWGHFPKIVDLDSVERDLIIIGLRVGKLNSSLTNS
jgi:phosphinothricin acetyltransferase